MDLKTVYKNINKLTSKEKVGFIETLLGVSVTMSQFLAIWQEKLPFSLPEDIHYAMLLSFANLNALVNPDSSGEIKDYSLNLDSCKDKLIFILKQLNEIYKDELNDAN